MTTATNLWAIEIEEILAERERLDAWARGRGTAPNLTTFGTAKATTKDRPLEFTMSEESPDRAGDTILASAWELDNFRRNPILAWAHSYATPPIGVWDDVHVEGKQLIGTARFDRNDEFARQIERKYRDGVLSAVSVGFRPLKATPSKESRGYVFERCELLECSAVSVPMHPGALRKAFALGFDMGSLGDARQVLGALRDARRDIEEGDLSERSARIQELVRRLGGQAR